jgi:hypothetical protein
MEAFRSVLLKVDECNAARLKLTAEMADSSHQVRWVLMWLPDFSRCSLFARSFTHSAPGFVGSSL